MLLQIHENGLLLLQGLFDLGNALLRLLDLLIDAAAAVILTAQFLLDTGNIAEEKSGNTCLYRITDQGIHVADNLQSNVLTAIRERSLKSALRLLSFKKKGSEIRHHSEELATGGYKLTCSIVEEREEIMNVSVFLDNKAQLEKMEYNFEKNPEVVYRGLLALLSGEINYLVN